MPLQTYTGKYQHPLYGEMDITIENNVLAVRRGNLYAVSTPFTEKESIRVELIPGSGTVVYFKVDDSGKVISVTHERMEYKRVN
jgi:hypothetical protein